MREVNLSHAHSGLMFALQAKSAFMNSISVLDKCFCFTKDWIQIQLI